MAEQEKSAARPFWSGTITFGLVSVPVNLFAAHRGGRPSLRTLGPEGKPLERRYYSQESGEDVGSQETTRGFELEDGRIIVVTDEELERVAPEKTRDINLQQFVPEDSIPPLYFQRSYFLTPAGSSTKAYRLLAKTMEDEGRAGVATFVMRGREYLVAIFAQRGILRAETLRFHDEVRTPADVGLPENGKAKAALVKRFTQAVRRIEAESLREEDTIDEETRRLLALVEQKRKQRQNVVEAPEEARTGAEVIDMMEVLKRSLRAKGADRTEGAPRKGPGRLDELSRDELYDRAKRLRIAGRSKMDRRDLMEAVRRAAS